MRARDVPARPWRNGGGTTREIFAWPAGGDWRIRISVADIVTDGPFSAYPGVERWTAVLEGSGVELSIDGRKALLRPGDAPLRFSGESTVDCRLIDGPVRDLNLMLRGACGAMCPAVAGTPWVPPPAAAAGFFGAAAGRCEGIRVPRHTLLWFPNAPPVLTFAGGGQSAVSAGWWFAAGSRGIPI